MKGLQKLFKARPHKLKDKNWNENLNCLTCIHLIKENIIVRIIKQENNLQDFCVSWGSGLCLWGQGDPGFWFPPLPGGFGRHRVICSEISSTVCFAGGWERRQGVVGNERSNLLSVGCECVYCCTAVGSVWCWYVLWSGPDSMEGRQHTAASRNSGTKTKKHS